jgi:hypothetical protein
MFSPGAGSGIGAASASCVAVGSLSALTGCCSRGAAVASATVIRSDEVSLAWLLLSVAPLLGAESDFESMVI